MISSTGACLGGLGCLGFFAGFTLKKSDEEMWQFIYMYMKFAVQVNIVLDAFVIPKLKIGSDNSFISPVIGFQKVSETLINIKQSSLSLDLKYNSLSIL